MMDNEKNNEIAQEQLELSENHLNDVSGGVEGGWGPNDKPIDISTKYWGPLPGFEPRYKVGQVILGDYYILKVNKSSTGRWNGTYCVASAFNHNSIIDVAMPEATLWHLQKEAGLF